MLVKSRRNTALAKLTNKKASALCAGVILLNWHLLRSSLSQPSGIQHFAHCD